MFKSWRVGTIAGFPVELNLSFLLLLGLVLVAFGGLMGVGLILILFASVLVHELGHSLVARQLGVRVSGIELSFFGGAAKMTDMPRNAKHEALIAAAGPAVSLGIGGLAFGIGSILGSPLFSWIGYANFILAAFNLIPALPMDGGRILRALLSRKMDYVQATDIAVGISRVAAVGFVVWALAGGPIMLIALAPYLWLMGTQEKMVARMIADRYLYTREGYVERAPRYVVLRRSWF